MLSSLSVSNGILKFATQYSFYSNFIIFGFGVISNALNLLVFIQLKLFRTNRCAFYITIESISNLIYFVFTITITILTSIYGDTAIGGSTAGCKIKYMVGQICALTTFYMVCFSAVDQFFSTNHRYNLRQMCTLKLGRYFAYMFICFVIIHSIVLGSSYDIKPTLGCVISNYIWIQYSTFFFYPILGGFLPIIIASSFSILAYRNVRHIIRQQLPIVRRKLDKQITAMVLMRVIAFVCLLLSYITYRIYAINFPIPQSIHRVIYPREIKSQLIIWYELCTIEQLKAISSEKEDESMDHGEAIFENLPDSLPLTVLPGEKKLAFLKRVEISYGLATSKAGPSIYKFDKHAITYPITNLKIEDRIS
ncbi:unnamed protein product [Adineta steineri]|uniref:G-protein coupled receptors family 1 profile domain-containing protein n=1 Tax=Adineta steineri TaxID=433720 RepID=A0A815R811_9BILA|nr:unnamed protein product [Adineta steineri]CAF3947428.1 unnamed protein product [Adineta steineri]